MSFYRNETRRSGDRRIGIGYHHHQPRYAKTYREDDNLTLSYYDGYNIPFQQFADDVCRLAKLRRFQYYEEFLDFIYDHLYDEARDVARDSRFHNHLDLLDLLDECFNEPEARLYQSNYSEGYYHDKGPSLPYYNGHNMPSEYFAEHVCRMADSRIFYYYKEFIDFVYDHLYDEAKYVAKNYLDDNSVSSYVHTELLDLLDYHFNNRKFNKHYEENDEPSKVLSIADREKCDSEFEGEHHETFKNNLRNANALIGILLSMRNRSTELAAQVQTVEETLEITPPLHVEILKEIRIEPTREEVHEPLQRAEEQSITVQADQIYINAEESQSESMVIEKFGSGYSSDNLVQEISLSAKDKTSGQSSKNRCEKYYLRKILMKLWIEF